jgi:lipoprotein signal peptidase
MLPSRNELVLAPILLALGLSVFGGLVVWLITQSTSHALTSAATGLVIGAAIYLLSVGSARKNERQLP